MNILIMDDSCEVTNWLYKFVTRKSKHKAVKASSIDEANQALIREAFDLIICDISMPAQDGDDFILAHRDLVGAARVVFISANNEDRLIQAQNKLIDNGFNSVSYIQKPIVLNDLLELIK